MTKQFAVLGLGSFGYSMAITLEELGCEVVAVEKFDILDDKPCQNFIGSRSTFENLSYITNKNTIFKSKLKPQDKEILFSDLSSVLSETHLKKIWDMLWARWCVYEKLCNL